MRKRERGFSLIELLIVVAIILIIAAIAIPNLIRAKISANESATVANMRTMNTAQTTYFTTYKAGYAATLATLGPPPGGGQASVANADLLDPVMASGTKNGYSLGTGAPGCAVNGTVFLATGQFNNPNQDASGNNIDYNINAGPVTCGRSGQRTFWTDESAVIRGYGNGPCNGPTDANCTPI